jgi:hypothetical protein
MWEHVCLNVNYHSIGVAKFVDRSALVQQVARSRYVATGHKNGRSGADIKKSYWSKPVQGELKCNIDAAIFDQQRCYGVGMCIRNEGDLATAKIIRREAIIAFPPHEV